MSEPDRRFFGELNEQAFELYRLACDERAMFAQEAERLKAERAAALAAMVAAGFKVVEVVTANGVVLIPDLR